MLYTADIDIHIFYRAFGSDTWLDVGRFVASDSLPSFSENDKSSFAQSSFKLISPKDFDNNYIVPKVGDDICITTDNSKTEILGNGNCYGKILRINSTIKTWDFEVSPPTPKGWEYDITIEQPLLNQSLSTLLDLILANNTKGLGGIINGETVNKYILESDDINIPSFVAEGAIIDILNQLLDEVGLQWKVISFVEPEPTNILNVVSTILIW
jgi:hypothetical protein